MIKRRTLKEDGRYLIYFDFERSELEPALGAGDAGHAVVNAGSGV
jgi:hypothetical protein